MIALVACCGPKLRHAAAAADLYRSPLFVKSRAVAEQYPQWFVLSARYGLVHPATVIAPYDLTLPVHADGWGWMVRQQLDELGLSDSEFVAFAGDRYTAPLLTAGLKVKRPLQGLGIGEQLRWLKDSAECEAGQTLCSR